MPLFRAYPQRFLNATGGGLRVMVTAVLLDGIRFWRRGGLLAGGSHATHINHAVPPTRVASERPLSGNSTLRPCLTP